MQELVPKASIDLSIPLDKPGLVGAVQAVHGMLASVQPGEVPCPDELLCVSGVAFKNYVYAPQMNVAESPPRAYSDEATWVCNYGAFESLGYYTGGEVREFNAISREDFWGLLRFEIAQGRPVLSMGMGGALYPALVVGYDAAVRPASVELVRSGASARETCALPPGEDMQPSSPSFTNWLVIVRAGEAAEWTASAHRQRLRALQWAMGHARRTKEFSQETRENYAPGLAGFDAFDASLDELVPGDLGHERFICDHLDSLIRGRRAIASRLPVWADEWVGASQPGFGGADAVAGAASSAAASYAEVAGCLEPWRQTLEGAPSDDGGAREVDVAGLRSAHRQAREAEARAVVEVERLLDSLPRVA